MFRLGTYRKMNERYVSFAGIAKTVSFAVTC
jgi:hypothetical protein